MRHILAASAAVLLLVAAFGCTPRKGSGIEMVTPEAAWKVFRAHYCEPLQAPGTLIKASLYYTRVTPTRRTNRTVVSMWGNYDNPMRLDIAAGMGKLLAHIREDRDGLLVFYPTEAKAYAHVDPVLGATRLGMPFPFSLSELARVISGDFSGLVPARFIEATAEGETFVYTLHGSEVTSITLDRTGRPILLAGRTLKRYANGRTWTLAVDKYDEPPRGEAPLPDRLTLAMDNGEQGVLRIKSRELRVNPWPDAATGLTLPDNIEIHRLDNGYGSSDGQDIPVVYEDAS